MVPVDQLDEVVLPNAVGWFTWYSVLGSVRFLWLLGDLEHIVFLVLVRLIWDYTSPHYCCVVKLVCLILFNAYCNLHLILVLNRTFGNLSWSWCSLVVQECMASYLVGSILGRIWGCSGSCDYHWYNSTQLNRRQFNTVDSCQFNTVTVTVLKQFNTIATELAIHWYNSSRGRGATIEALEPVLVLEEI